MKKSALFVPVVALGLAFASCSGGESSASSDCNATIETILTRTSVRSYSDREVESGKIDTLLRAAMAAPTAVNKQPWRFVVVNDKATLKSISENFGSMRMAAGASVAVIMCGDMDATLEGEDHDYWVQDVSAASENLLLAAHALGLGAVWCGIYPVSERVAQFSEMLSLPENIIPMACICLGYPSGEFTPKDKWKPEYIHYNTWDDTPTF